MAITISGDVGNTQTHPFILPDTLRRRVRLHESGQPGNRPVVVAM